MASPEEGRNLVETNRERQEHLRHLQKEAFQLANYYFVFQGVIFTAFYSTPSVLKCHYHCIPFVLSLLAGFLNLCALSTIAFKYKTTLDDMDKYAMGVARGNTPPPSERGSDHEAIAVKCARFWRLLKVVFCMGLFIGFFVITLIGSWKITCGQSPSTPKPPSPAAA